MQTQAALRVRRVPNVPLEPPTRIKDLKPRQIAPTVLQATTHPPRVHQHAIVSFINAKYHRITIRGLNFENEFLLQSM